MTDMPPYLAVKDEEKNSEPSNSEVCDIEDLDLPLCYDEPRHLEPIKGPERIEHTWRVKEKYKTHCVALVLCLNVGVDPPDVVKTQPCARLECWIDPLSFSPSKALENIGNALQAQYERWQPRARYKQSLDPTSEEVKKLCCSLRRNAKDERVLFHYNGHGVPKPTTQGEIWVFNRTYTQYIPLSMYDLQTWMGAPSLYVYDCSNAGVILENFKLFADQHERDYEMQCAKLEENGQPIPPIVSYKNCIQLAACAAGQTLPMNPELPADLFTSCLTTPVKTAIKWFVLRNKTRITPNNINELIDKIPGQVTDRRTMLGELNWIFTAITDTIAWNSLPSELFQQLFRADLLTASLCRNFLLADRIMRSYNCTPVCSAALPSLAGHGLWGAWEHALDLALAQLPGLCAGATYRPSPFFRQQLSALRLWLALPPRVPTARAPPPQLPVVLQVLLSTLHRLRALRILCRFLARGSHAVRALLHVGIFPYMLKLLQASAPDLRPAMVYIWAKIIAVDPSCQVDLVNAKGHKYFISILQDPTVSNKHRTLAAYVLAGIVKNYPPGQEAALQGSLISTCLVVICEERLWCALRVWACIALARAWRGYEDARGAAARDLAHDKLFPLLRAPQPALRAAAAAALHALLAPTPTPDAATQLHHQIAVVLAGRLLQDAAVIVRREILAALQWSVLTFEQHFIAVCIQERMRRSDRVGIRTGRVEAGQDALAPAESRRASSAPHLPTIGFGSVYMKLWDILCAMSKEPHPDVSQMATEIINYIANQLDSLGREVENIGVRSSCSSSGSSSLPPSPNTRPSPPHHTRTLPGHRRGKSGLPSTISEESVSPRERDRESTSSNSSHTLKKPIVSTEFIEWAGTQFVRDSSGYELNRVDEDADVDVDQTDLDTDSEGEGEAWCGGRPRPDPESPEYHERQWRRTRNRQLRIHAAALRSARISRLETQAFHSRCPLPPSVILFHPYEQHAAVASKDNFGVWDWGTAAKLCVGGWRRVWGRITALSYMHAHHRALLAVASHNGHLAIYRPVGSGTEATLVAAWRALPTRRAPHMQPPRAQPLYSGIGSLSGINDSTYSAPQQHTRLAWCERRRTLALAGLANVLRVWDATTELLLLDIDTECEAGTTSLWRGDGSGELGHEVVAGFADGSVRAWDERTCAAPRLVLREHCAPVLCAAHRPDRYLLLTACMNGKIRIYDNRKSDEPLQLVTAPGPLAAVDLHSLCDLFACGSINQCISLFDLKGAPLNTIKFHEGFMGARIGPVSCLTFHPLRCAMGVGSKDSTVSVYAAERR